MDLTANTVGLLPRTIEKFWETVPPAWNAIRAFIRETAARDFDITVEQFHILRHVAKGSGSISELAQAKHISRPAISQAVDMLVNKGLLTRCQDERDRRFVKLELTEDGAALLSALFERSRQWMTEKLSILSDEDLHALLRAFQSLHHIFMG
jgi:MarR family transcriptional regulator, organic hydroperoxide resistance regulator